MTTHDIQRALAAAGHDPGPADGEMGPRTRAAIREFQGRHGLLTDGIAGPVTLGALAVGSQGAIRVASPRPMAGARRRVHTVVVHCTASREGQDLTVAQVDAMHRAQGWSRIGYHWLVRPDGTVEKGRDEAEVGAHVSGHNTGSIGISYVGGLDRAGRPKDTRTAAQRRALLRLVADLCARHPVRAIVGHRDLSPDLDGDGIVEAHEWVKQCPCFDAVPEYGALIGPGPSGPA